MPSPAGWAAGSPSRADRSPHTVRDVGSIDVHTVRGTDEDLALIAPLWRAMVEHHRQVAGDELPVRDADDAWTMRRREYRAWLDDGSGALLVAGADGAARPDGYAFCRLVRSGPTFDFGQARGEVESLVVAPHARGAGVGTALLEGSRHHLRDRGCTHWTVSVMAANDGAVQLYQRVGFRPWLLELAAPLDDVPDQPLPR